MTWDDKIDDDTFKAKPEEFNVMYYLGGEKHPVKRLHFSSEKYPPPLNMEDMKCRAEDNKCKGWNDLKKDLCTSAHYNGGQLIKVNGYSQSSNINHRFVCATLHHKDNPVYA